MLSGKKRKTKRKEQRLTDACLFMAVEGIFDYYGKN